MLHQSSDIHRYSVQFRFCFQESAVEFPTANAPKPERKGQPTFLALSLYMHECMLSNAPHRAWRFWKFLHRTNKLWTAVCTSGKIWKESDSAWPSFQSQAACEESTASCELFDQWVGCSNCWVWHMLSHPFSHSFRNVWTASPSVLTSQACIFSKLTGTKTADSKGTVTLALLLCLSFSQSSCFDLLRKRLLALYLVPRRYQPPSANASDAKHGCRSAWTWVQELRWPGSSRVWRKHADICELQMDHDGRGTMIRANTFGWSWEQES